MDVNKAEEDLKRAVKGGLLGGGVLPRLKSRLRKGTITVSAIIAMLTMSSASQVYAQEYRSLYDQIIKTNEIVKQLPEEERMRYQEEKLLPTFAYLAVEMEKHIEKLIKEGAMVSAKREIAALEHLAKEFKDEEILVKIHNLRNALKEYEEIQSTSNEKIRMEIVSRVKGRGKGPSIEHGIHGHTYLVFVENSRIMDEAKKRAERSLEEYVRGRNFNVKGRTSFAIVEQGKIFVMAAFVMLD